MEAHFRSHSIVQSYILVCNFPSHPVAKLHHNGNVVVYIVEHCLHMADQHAGSGTIAFVKKTINHMLNCHILYTFVRFHKTILYRFL